MLNHMSIMVSVSTFGAINIILKDFIVNAMYSV